MSHKSRLIATIGAVIVLGTLVASASANRLSLSNQNFRATWTMMTFTAVLGAGVTVRCPVTLEGSFHSRTLQKAVRSLIGYITRAVFKEESCVGGRAMPLPTTLPWHIQYRGFLGTLPEIAKINTNVIGMGFLVLATYFLVPNTTCLHTTTGEQPALLNFIREMAGPLTSAEIGGAISTTDMGCTTITLSGTTNSLTLLNSTSQIIVRLI